MEEDAILQGGLHRPSEASPKAHDTVNPVVHALRKVPVATRDTVKKEITRLVGEGHRVDTVGSIADDRHETERNLEDLHRSLGT